MNSLLLNHNKPQLDDEVTAASSTASVATAERTTAGFNMRQYEEELIKLRNDNFSLKLRIHLLEERQGKYTSPDMEE